MTNELAQATVHWLNYKRLAGLRESLFSEALLMTPIIDFLIGRRYGEVDAECDSTMFKFGGAGEFNYDIAAKGAPQAPRSILLETKYLKKNGNDARLLIDLLKLALPTNEQCPGDEWKRMLLVAGQCGTLQSSNVIKKLKKGVMNPG